MIIDIVVIILVLSWVFALGMALGGWIKERRIKKKILSEENIVACFKDVDWAIQTFSIGGQSMKALDGTEHFYKVHSIKDAIEKLNKLLDGES